MVKLCVQEQKIRHNTMTRHQHSTIRNNICNRPNAQVRGPYSRLRISPGRGVFQKPYQGHPGLVACQAIWSGGNRFPFFIFSHQIPYPDQEFSCYSHNSLFSACPFTHSIKDSSGFVIFSNSNPCRINEGFADKDRAFFGDFPIANGFIRGKDSGTKSCIRSQFIRMIKPGKISYFTDKTSTDGIPNTRNRCQNFIQWFKSIQMQERFYFLFRLFNLSFIIKKVFRDLHKKVFMIYGKLFSETSKKQFQRASGNMFRSGQIVFQKNSMRAVDQRGVLSHKIMSVSGQFSKGSQGFVRHEASQRFISLKFSAGKQERKFFSIATICFGLIPAILSGLNRIRKNKRFHFVFKKIKQPVIKTNGFYNNGAGMQLRLCKKLFYFPGAFTSNLLLTYPVSLFVTTNNGHAIFMKIHSYIYHFFLPVIRALGKRVVFLVSRSISIDNHFFMEGQNV